MSRMYSIEFADVAVTAAQDFFAIRPVADKPILIHAVFLSQTDDVGDSAEEMLLVQFIRGATTIGSGGTNPTARPLDSNDTAFGPTTNVRVNDTTEASSGTRVDIHSEAFNIRTGMAYIPTPECRIRCDNADGFIEVALIDVPSDSLTMSGTMYVEEL